MPEREQVNSAVETNPVRKQKIDKLCTAHQHEYKTGAGKRESDKHKNHAAKRRALVEARKNGRPKLMHLASPIDHRRSMTLSSSAKRSPMRRSSAA
jgi:hypothetical protein